ncbi:MAG: trimethylamine methyltransferase family protein [Planctomycetota bacterium]
MRLSRFTVLSDAEIRAIHEASLEILETCGVKVLDRTALARLGEKGLEVEAERAIVRFSRAAVEDAIARAPRTFEVFDRDGRLAFVLGDGAPRVAAGHNSVFWVDSDTGRTRPATVADVERFSAISEHLPGIDMVGVPAMPQDVPDPRSSVLHGLRAVIENSRKPVYFSTDNARANRACIELLRAAFPGDIRERVYGVSQLSPTSPLFWEEGVAQALLDTLDAGVPIAILPEPIAGFTAPYALAALLTMNNAECLSGIAMAEILRPGAKILYANSWTTFDMRSAAALVGSVETSVCRIAGAQLARFYGIPCHTTAPNSDNHAHDEQNAWEKTLSQLCAIAAGNDLIVNCGMFATGMTSSDEQLLMDEEITELARRLVRGVEVTEEAIAADLIRRIGPQGRDYLTEEHTVRRLRSDEFFHPRLSVRGPRAAWEAAGAKDTYQIAREKAREYARRPRAVPPAAVREKLAEIAASFSKEAE